VSNALRFELAVEDVEASESAQEYDLHTFELPGHPDGTETYAVVRPAADAWVALSRTALTARQNQQQMEIAAVKFLDECLNADDLREALIESGEYADVDEDGDGDLSAFGLELARSNERLNDRLMNRRDPFGVATLVKIYLDMVERWSGNPIGSPQDYLPPQKRTGAKSTATRSSKASTSRGSSSKARRGTSRRSTSS
jgi:hypothetical protein